MAFTIGSGTFTNGSATVTNVSLTSGTLAYFASGTRMVVGTNPVVQEVEAIAAPTVTTITLRNPWSGTGGTYDFLANQTSEGLRDAVQSIRTANSTLQEFIDSISTTATANSVAQRTSDGSLNATDLNASGNAFIGTTDSNATRLTATDGGGSCIYGNSVSVFSRQSGTATQSIIGINQTGVDAPFIDFRKDGVTVGNIGTSSGDIYFGSGSSGTERMRIDSSGNVGIGTSSPDTKLVVGGLSGPRGLKINQDAIELQNSSRLFFDSIASGWAIYNNGGSIAFNSGAVVNSTSGTERMRIDSNGNVLIGTTDDNGTRLSATTGGGICLYPSSVSVFSRQSATSIQPVVGINQTGVDAPFIDFRKDGVTEGSISLGGGVLQLMNNATGLFIGDAGTNKFGFATGDDAWRPATDNALDLGTATRRYNDVYATNATIQTSDRNEKQDIEELSEAEHRVAVTCKGLLRKFRWKSSFDEKGDDARIHFGIIAQDLQAAFEAEGLDAGRYAMFTHTEWWEHEVEVPAVEAKDAVVDEDGNVIEEAVEGQDAYTRTDTYYREEEAPEGSVKKSRMGVRYSELLAFIIAAL